MLERLRKLIQPDITLPIIFLVVLLNIIFFPVIWGERTLIHSAGDVASIMPYGAHANNAEFRQLRRSNDDGAPGWFAEPSYALLHEEFAKRGVLPLWNPYNGFGAPLLANMQSQPLNPLVWIACINPSPLADDLFVISRLLLGGILASLYFRRFVGNYGAIFGATAFMLSGYFLIFLNMPEISVSIWMPGLFLALELLAEKVNLNRVALTAFMSAMILLGGMPEVAFLELFVSGLYFAYRTLCLHSSTKARGSAVAGYLISCLLGLCFAAPQILPFLEYLRESSNTHVGTIGAGRELGPGSVYHLNFPAHFLNYLTPLIYGQIGDPKVKPGFGYDGFNGYWGVLAFSFALLAIFESIASLRKKSKPDTTPPSVQQRSIVFFFLAVATILLSKKFGAPVISLIGILPLFRLIVFWKYSEPIIAFAISAMAAIGFDGVVAGRNKLRTILMVFSLSIAVLLSTALYDKHFIWGNHEVHVLFNKILTIAIGLIVLAALICALSVAKPAQRLKSARLLILLLCIDLSFSFLVPTFYWFHRLAADKANPYAGAPFIEYLQQNTKSGERILGFDGVLFPNWSSAFALHDIRNLDAMYPAGYLRFVRNFLTEKEPDELADFNLTTRFHGMEAAADPLQTHARIDSLERLLYLSSVRYLLGTQHRFSSDQLNSAFKLVYDKEIKIYENKKWLSRTTLFHRYELSTDDQQALATLRAKEFDPGSAVLLAQKPADNFRIAAVVQPNMEKDINTPNDEEHQRDKATLVSDAPLEQIILVDAKSDAMLLLTDQYYPGWKAEIDGKPEQIIRANFLFKSVPVSAGAHKVVFKYEPVSFYLGACISALALFALSACAFVLRKTNNSRSNS